MSLKAKIEAVLFLTDKPMRAAAVAKIVNEDVQVVRQVLLDLIADYEARGGALEIAQDNGYIIQVKDEYSPIIEEFAPTELSAALLRTLSAIAIKQPVAQSEIIRIRGAGAYEHVKLLLERELINKEETGRSPVLTTTKKFQEYFRLTHDAKSLRDTIKKQDKAEADKQKAADEAAEAAKDAKQLTLLPETILQSHTAQDEAQTDLPGEDTDAEGEEEKEPSSEFDDILGAALEPNSSSDPGEQLNFEPVDVNPLAAGTPGDIAE